MKKVVVQVSINAGDREQSPFKNIFINIGKIIMPWKFVWKHFTPTPSQNKINAFKIAVSFPGVEEASIQGEGKNQIAVKADDDFDPVKLIEKLRKKVASAVIVSVGPVTEKEKEKEKEKTVDPTAMCSYPHYHHYGVPHMELVEISQPRLCGIF